MKSCREVSTVTLQDAPPASLLGRAEIWLHLAMCRHCRRLWHQVRTVDRRLRAVLGRADEDAPRDLEDRIVERVRREPRDAS